MTCQIWTCSITAQAENFWHTGSYGRVVSTNPRNLSLKCSGVTEPLLASLIVPSQWMCPPLSQILTTNCYLHLPPPRKKFPRFSRMEYSGVSPDFRISKSYRIIHHLPSDLGNVHAACLMRGTNSFTNITWMSLGKLRTARVAQCN